MRNTVLQSLVIIAVVFMVGMAQAGDPYAVGEKWTYKHEGAVPMRPPDFTMTGDRTREVVGVQGENEKKCWVIQEVWGTSDEQSLKRFVGADRMYEKMEAGTDRVMTVKPALPFESVSLKVDEEKTVESTFQFGQDFSFPFKMKVQRVQNETIKVPAGEFENCMHFEIEETVTFSPPNADPMTIVTKREQWFSPKVNGVVKEIFTVGSPDGSTSTGTSELKSYAKEKKE